MDTIKDHPKRYALANELHARPFPSIPAPGHAVFMAVKPASNAASRDRKAELDHLIKLLDHFGAPHPQPGATHYFGALGRHHLKWESHTEFTSFTMFSPGLTERAFDPAAFEVFPPNWLADMPGERITSALIRVESRNLEDPEIDTLLREWFVHESVAASRVVDQAAIVASDFRIDSAGHMRMAAFIQPGTGPSRIGRIVQRMTEIETYKAMSMLGLPRAQELSAEMAQIDPGLSTLVSDLSQSGHNPDDTLQELLTISAQLEQMTAKSAFRFGATAAYEAIVKERVIVLREERYMGYQTLKEFMQRRYDPAMRTVRSIEQRLQNMTARAARVGDLLRTQVDVDRSSQNQKLLESMDRRADLQLRLQKTVEGLSVVAISYYAVSLTSYAAYPLAAPLGLSKGMLTAVLTPIVVLIVWFAVHRIRKSME